MSKPTYRVDAERRDGWWLLTSADAPGAVSQVRRLTAADEHAREAIAFVLDVEPDSFDLALIPALESGLTDVVAATREAVRLAAQAQLVAAEQSRQVVAELMSKERLSGAEVAAVLGLSAQRVSQLASRIATPARKRPKNAAKATPRVAAKTLRQTNGTPSRRRATVRPGVPDADVTKSNQRSHTNNNLK